MDKKLQDYLAGLTDKKLHTSDNMLIHSAGKKKNAKFSDTMREVAGQRDDQYRQAHQQGCQNRDNSYQAETNARAEVQAKISQSLAGVAKTQDHKQALRATTTNKPGNAEWEAAHLAGLARRDKPFHAGPYGVFPSLNAAGRAVMERGLLKNAIKKFENWKKTDPDNYYFIKT